MAILRILIFTLAVSLGAASTGMSEDPYEPKVYIANGNAEKFPSCAEILKEGKPSGDSHFYDFCLELSKAQTGESSENKEGNQVETGKSVDQTEQKTTVKHSKWKPSVYCPQLLAREEPEDSEFLKKLWNFCQKWAKHKPTWMMSGKARNRSTI